MDWIARQTANPSTVLILVVILFAFAITFSLKFRSVVRRSKLGLQSGVRIVHEMDPSEFSAKYSEIVEQVGVSFSADRYLTRQWQRFLQQLTHGTDEIISHNEPEVFFNSSTLLRDRWLPLCKAGPGYLVGIGLVFTFLGIAVVTYRASVALGSNGDLQALCDLLGAASLKFWTSLVGVALSILCSGYFRHLTAEFDLTASGFSYALSKALPIVRQEHAFVLSNNLLSRQIDSLLDLKNTLSQGQREASLEIVEEIQSLRDGVISLTGDAFSDLVERIARKFSTAIGNSVKEVAETFVSINGDLKTAIEQIKSVSANFGSLSQEMNCAMLETTKQLHNVGRELNEGLVKVKVSNKEIAANFALSSDSAERIKDSLSSLPDSISSATKSFAPLTELPKVSTKLHEASAALCSSSDALLANWQQQSEHVKAVEEKLAHTVAALPTVFNQYSAALQGFTNQFEKNLARAVESLSVQIESLESSQNSLRFVVENLHSARKIGWLTRNGKAT